MRWDLRQATTRGAQSKQTAQRRIIPAIPASDFFLIAVPDFFRLSVRQHVKLVGRAHPATIVTREKLDGT
jgi:hypothetical protein